MGVGIQHVSLGGFCFISPVFKIHVLLSNYIQSILSTQLSLRRLGHVYNLNLVNVLCVHVLCVQLSLQCLRRVYSF